MLDERLIDKLVERLVGRIEEVNTYTLLKIGESINKIGTLSPSKAQQLAQVLKYGGNYNAIADKLAKITNLNIKDIYEIFEEVAKSDYLFAKQFYDYRGAKYIPYEENFALQNQVKALARITASEYANFSKTLAFSKIENGKVVYTTLSQTYQDAIDKAVLSVAQGKDTFQDQMYKTIRDLGSSGIKTVDYVSGRSVRLDSSVRQHMKGALRNLHNETQAIFGEEFGSDGVEISVHLNPAPDHAEVQGRQFSKEEFRKFQNDQTAVDYKGKVFPPEHEGHDRRSISEYNCYHYTFDIVLGVSKPEYSVEELQKINENNNKGFELDGVHYTNYEGTQLQRKLETEIRKQKDIQIMAKASGNKELVAESQSKITQLTHKYKKLSNISGLPTKMERMRVSQYKRTSVANIIDYNKPLNNIEDIASYVNSRKKELYGLDVKQNQLKLNEKNNFNDKPKLINEKEFDNLDDNFDYSDPNSAKNNQYVKVFRGWGDKKYYEKYINGENSYGDGGYVDGVGTYATDNEWSATQFADEEDDRLMEIAIPGSAKFISVEELNELHYKIYEEFNKNRELYAKKYGKEVVDILDTMNDNISSTAVLNNYDVSYNDQYRNWVILNRGIIKIKKK